MVIPGKALEEVTRLAGDADEVVLGVSENQVVFEFGSTVFVTRRIEGSFPNYKQLIPKESETTATVSAEELDGSREARVAHGAPQHPAQDLGECG